MRGLLRRTWSGPLAVGPPQRDGFSPGVAVGGGEPGLDGLGVGAFAQSRESQPPSSLSTAFAVIKVLAATQGSLPRRIHERDDLSRKVVRDRAHRFLWGAPNAEWRTASVAWWWTAFAHLEGWANVYMWRDRFNADTVGLSLIHPSRVMVMRVKGKKLFVIDGNRERVYTADDILHIPGLSFDGVRGIPPVQAGIMAHDMALQLERFGRTFLRKGSAPSGVVTSTAELSPASVKEFYQRWDDMHSGSDNVGSVVLVQGGSGFERITIPPEEAQYLQSRAFSREEVLGYYAPSMPHHLLGWKSNTSNFGTGIEAQGQHLVRYVLLNRLTLVEDAISQELLPPELVIEFDVSALLRGDAKTQAEVFSKMRQGGAVSAEEWRAAASYPPREFGDDFMYPLNNTRIDAATGDPWGDDDEPEPPPAPPPMMFPQPQPTEDEEETAALVLEARCENESCPSRAGGKLGQMLAQNVGRAEIMCPQCHHLTRIRAGRTLRDGQDLAEAVAARLRARAWT